MPLLERLAFGLWLVVRVPGLLSQGLGAQTPMFQVDHQLVVPLVVRLERALVGDCLSHVHLGQLVVAKRRDAVLVEPLFPVYEPAPAEPLRALGHVAPIGRLVVVGIEDVEAVGHSVLVHGPVVPAPVTEFVGEVSEAKRRNATSHVRGLPRRETVRHARIVGLSALPQLRRVLVEHDPAQLFDCERLMRGQFHRALTLC